jgi:dimethylhistidine N-methyltransferase
MATSRAVSISPFAGDVLRGLSQRQKSLPPKLFYDAAGSELFEQICQLPEYYLTRTERAILQHHAATMSSAAGPVATVVELGAGSASKTSLLLESLSPANGAITYVPIDVSASALEMAARQLQARLHAVKVVPLVADYTRELPLRKLAGPKLVLYIGSSLGNFEPLQAAALMARVRRGMHAGDRVLLGIDLAKAPEVLLPAYDDAQGVTAAFNKNILAHINRELGGNFSPESFDHLARWNPAESRIEMHLRSAVPQRVWLAGPGRGFSFRRGETIHTENSYKYTPAMLGALFSTAGLHSLESWTDERHWFEVHLLGPG